MSSILGDVRHKIGPSGDYDYFDTDMLDAINAAFAKLNQLGAGPDDGFEVTSEDQQWEEFSTNKVLLGFVKTFVYDTVRLIFDTPNTSFVISEIRQRLEENTFRILVECDPKQEG